MRAFNLPQHTHPADSSTHRVDSKTLTDPLSSQNQAGQRIKNNQAIVESPPCLQSSKQRNTENNMAGKSDQPFRSETKPGSEETDAGQTSLDEHLFQRIAEADESALRELHDRYRDLVFSVARNICGQDQDAETVLVTVFWTVWRKPKNWNPDRGSVRMYLYVLSRSRAQDLIRSRTDRAKRLRQHSDGLALHHRNRVSDTSPTRILESNAQADTVRNAVDDLPDSVRSVIEMSFFRGLTHIQISDETTTPLGTVKTRIRRGLELLRQRFDLDQEDGKKR